MIDPATLASSTVLATVVTTLGLILNNLLTRKTRQAATPADENETVRLGNEFIRDLLKDAREERTELRKSIDELESGRTADKATIDRLKALDAKKTGRIEYLERELEKIAKRLAEGELVTASDVLAILGRELASEVDDLEDTIVTS